MKKKSVKKTTDFPFEYYTGQPRLEFYGTDECVVDGLKSIIKYSADEIVFNFGNIPDIQIIFKAVIYKSLCKSVLKYKFYIS